MTLPRTQPRALPRIRPMTPGIPHAARVRAYLAGVVVTAGLCGVAWRAWALQIDEGDHYRALATKQHALTVGIPAPRGDIIDARGRPLAVSAAADSIWANPREIRDVTDTADKLARLLGTGAVTLEAKLGGDRRFVWIDRHVTPELARVVRDAKLPGIEVSKEPRRWYPARAIGGSVVGRSDIDGNGLDGIELAMNAQLVGHRGAGLGLRDARGKKLFADGLEPPEAGATVQLSLDSSIQASAEAALAESVRTNKATSGVAVVVEVATGRVLAMASAPSYDPNAPTTPHAANAPDAGDSHDATDAPKAADGPGAPHAPVRDSRNARNRAVTDAFEAGSVMKIFSIAAALDDGTVAPDTEFDLGGGQLKLAGRAIPIRDVEHDLYLNVAGIIKRSSNVGAAKIALRFGADKLYAALKRFGFGRCTGIELPGEQSGMLRDGAKWRDVELATISFGYGLTVTPLQLAAAIAAFGDHGIYREPRIVDRVSDADGTLLYQAAPASRQVVSDRTATQMRAMLASVFEGGKLAGTAAKIVVPGFRCGGKTGTANKYDPALKGYSLDHYLSTFVGLAPIDHPRLAIAVLVDDPSGGDHFGAKVAGPVFATIASFALRYLGVPGESPICAPPVPGAPPSIAPKICLPAAALQAKPGPATAVPSGPAVQLHAGTGGEGRAPPFSQAEEDLEREPMAEPPPVTIPDFRGLGMARAIALAREAHVLIEVSGSGRVIRQDPAPGPSPDRSIPVRSAARIGSSLQGGFPSWAFRTRAAPSATPIVNASPGGSASPGEPPRLAVSPRVVLQFSDGNPLAPPAMAGTP
jgi:cell division protein FtsI (penicillin-binding protein 3)